jgi:integrase/recombinase XerD
MDHWKQLLEDELKLKGYSNQTINNYIYNISKYIASSKNPRNFLLSLIDQGKSNETVRSAGFSIKFYLKILKKEDPSIEEIISNLPNPKREKKLPEVLSKEEIHKMIKVTTNPIHRTIIQLGYASGLRVSETVNLKWSDLDFDRGIIHIKQSKGKKDRIVMLADKVKQSLNNLENSGEYIFKTNRGTKYTIRTIQKILESASKKANIQKKTTPHTLRHSFATHLLENGTDIRLIKELLGHSDLKTTLIYTKVSNREISKLKSPIDIE